MKIARLIVSIIFCFTGIASVYPQEGDQILDGIGETALSARYQFRGDVRDWSRNNLHAIINGTDYSFVNDSLFGNVLSLNGERETFISIPGEAVRGEESVSISGWINLCSPKSGQVFFDFGKSGKSHFFSAPTGTGEKEGCLTRIVTESGTYSSATRTLEANKWNHMAFVIDIPSKTLSVYINGLPAGSMDNMALEPDQLFGNSSEGNNKLYIGKSLDPGSTILNARLYDFRIYRIALSERQINRIYNSALRREDTSGRRRGEAERNLPEFSLETPRLYNEFLTGVEDIRVETSTGYMPRFQRFVKGIYSNDFDGPDVRVLWPAPEDNRQVLAPGTYTVTGKVAGTDLQPKAFVTVRAGGEPAAPARVLEAFDLDQVTLNNDIYDRKTKFIENRDKFIKGLAAANPDNFLYMFRNAFGQEQPEGQNRLEDGTVSRPNCAVMPRDIFSAP